MGYTLIIGNATMDYDKEYCSLKITAEPIELENSPAYGEPTDGTNQRWPSYIAWKDFTRFVGLYDLFFDKDFNGPNCEICLIFEHPGHTVISQYHKQQIDEAYERFYKKYPNCKPGYSPLATDFKEDPNWPEENSYAVRLEWLKFWVDYALQNCEIPIFYNS